MLTKTFKMKKHEILPSTRKAALFGKLFFPAILILFSGCSKDNPARNSTAEPTYAVDKEVYFTIQTGTDIHTSYGFYDKSGSENSGGQFLYIQKELDSGGAPIINIQISISNELVYGGGGWFSSTAPTHLNLGNCQGSISMTKPGTEITGTYHTRTGDATIFLINSTTQNKEQFMVDSAGLSLNITQEGQLRKGGNFADGNFSCNLVSSTSIPATGSFRLAVP
jgi:hypothetical protein